LGIAWHPAVVVDQGRGAHYIEQRAMTDLDDELKEAVQDGEAAAAQDPHGNDGPPAVGRGESSAPRRSLGLLVALLVIGGGILALLFSGVNDSAIYAVGTDQLVGQKAKFQDRNVRVQGVLVKGSLKHRADPCEYRFKIAKNGVELPVRYDQCIVPDTFKDVPSMDVEVTAEGRLAEGGGEYFKASDIMAKCPSKYEMKQLEKSGEQAPHGAISSDPLSSTAYDGK
jgi:cytochrome c-type biogenesis protein CcmE